MLERMRFNSFHKQIDKAVRHAQKSETGTAIHMVSQFATRRFSDGIDRRPRNQAQISEVTKQILTAVDAELRSHKGAFTITIVSSATELLYETFHSYPHRVQLSELVIQVDTLKH